METVRHYYWRSEYGDRGRLAVSVRSDFLTIKQLTGNAPPSSILFDILPLMGEDVIEKANGLHANRKNLYEVETRVGMSGCVNFLVRFERDAALLDYPISGRLHISMCGKLNEGVSLWLGDLPPVMAAMAADNVTIFDNREKIYLEDAEAHEREVSWPKTKLTLKDGSISFSDFDEGEEYIDADAIYLGEETLEKLRAGTFDEELE